MGAQVAEWANSNSGSLLGDLASMAMDRFSSADDIQAFINEHLTDDVVADAQAAAVEAQKLAQQWCYEGCTSTTARFLEGIFNHMNGGACQNRAASYFTRHPLPCCIENVVQKGIEAYDYVIENYEATLNEYAAAVGSGLSPTAIAEATKIKDDVVAEFQCVQEVYSANQPGCA